MPCLMTLHELTNHGLGVAFHQAVRSEGRAILGAPWSGLVDGRVRPTAFTGQMSLPIGMAFA